MKQGLSWKKLYRGCLYFLNKHSGWIGWPSGLLAIVLGTWSQLSAFKVAGWRPTDNEFFYGLIGSSLSASFVNVINKAATDERMVDMQEQLEASVNYYNDLLRLERIDALNDHLKEIFDNPKLAFGMQERICVYRYVGQDCGFECVGRYSQHPVFRTMSSRTLYPADMGIIAHVWSQGEFNGFKRDNSIPDPANKNKYLVYLRDTYKIPKDVARDFRMNPIDICALVLRDTKDSAVGVIIFESQRRAFIDEAKLKEVFTESKKGFIINSLEKLKGQKTPALRTAREAQL